MGMNDEPAGATEVAVSEDLAEGTEEIEIVDIYDEEVQVISDDSEEGKGEELSNPGRDKSIQKAFLVGRSHYNPIEIDTSEDEEKENATFVEEESTETESSPADIQGIAAVADFAALEIGLVAEHSTHAEKSEVSEELLAIEPAKYPKDKEDVGALEVIKNLETKKGILAEATEEIEIVDIDDVKVHMVEDDPIKVDTAEKPKQEKSRNNKKKQGSSKKNNFSKKKKKKKKKK